MGKARKAKEILFYIYLFNKKNIGYIVEFIEAIYFINNRFILSTIK